jgi:hypothetical protein
MIDFRRAQSKFSLALNRKVADRNETRFPSVPSGTRNVAARE